MHDWLGMALLALGLGLVAAAVMKRRSRMQTVIATGDIRPEFAAMGEIVRPLILTVVGLVALKMSVFYFVLGGQQYLTPLDFSALMLVLAAYSGYLVMATRKPVVVAARDSEPDVSGARSHA
jgi:hypothetical protein